MDVNADVLSAAGSITGVFQTTSGFVHNAAEDKTFYCDWNDGQGFLLADGSISGTLNTGNLGDGSISATGSISGEWIDGMNVSGLLSASGSISGEFYSEVFKNNWVGWSKIGEASFALDLVNDAGYKPMAWQGWVYQVKPLGKNVVVYGEGGITLMTPVGSPAPTFGFKDLSMFGLLTKELVAGNDKLHYYVNSKGKLCLLTEQGITVLGYEEFLYPLKSMGNRPVMHYDEAGNKLYICNGIVGYVMTDKGFGGGPKSLTGLISSVDGVEVYGNPDTTSGAMSFKTELISLGSRDVKVVQEVRISTDTTTALYCRIHHRMFIDDELTVSAWTLGTDSGEFFIEPVSCVEFQVEVKSATETDIFIDDLQISLLVPDNVKVPGEAK